MLVGFKTRKSRRVKEISYFWFLFLYFRLHMGSVRGHHSQRRKWIGLLFLILSRNVLARGLKHMGESNSRMVLYREDNGYCMLAS